MATRGGRARSACLAFLTFSALLASSLPKRAPPPAPRQPSALPPPRPPAPLRLRGAGPKKKPDLFKTSFAPGALPDWAQAIIDYRNSTTPLERVRGLRRALEEPQSSDLTDSDATTSMDCVWGGAEEGWVDVRKSEMAEDSMEDYEDEDGINSSGEFKSVRKRREWVRALKDLHGDSWNKDMLKMGGMIETMWYPDEPVFVNVSQRIERPMALHPDVLHPDRGDKNFLLREAAKLGELYEVERQVLGGADVNGTDPLFSDWTALHYAAWNNHSTTCAMLIRLGAYKFPLDHAGWMPWDCAYLRELWEMCSDLERLGANPPIGRTKIPQNFEGAEDRPFTCVNEYLNPNFTDTEVYKQLTLNWIEDPHHPMPDSLGPPVVPTEWFGTYNPRPNLTDDADAMRDDEDDPVDMFRDERERAALERERKEREAAEKEMQESEKEEQWAPSRDELDRIFLNCPFADKEPCKALGGRWDMERKKWYVPAGKDAKPFAKWWPPKPPNWVAPVRIKAKHAFNPGAIASKSTEESRASNVEDESSGSSSYGMGNMTLECTTPRPADGEFERNRPKPPEFHHYTNFSERPKNTVVENYEEDKLKKWAESEKGKQWKLRFEERLKQLQVDSSNEDTQLMDTMDEKEMEDKCQKLMDLWEETEETRLQQMKEELEKDRAEKRADYLNATKDGGPDPRTAAEKFWETEFDGTHLAVVNSTKAADLEQPKGPAQMTLFGAKSKPAPVEGPQPPSAHSDSKPANYTERMPITDIHEMEIQHINAQKYMAELNKNKLTDKQKEWFWDDPDVTSSGEGGLFG